MNFDMDQLVDRYVSVWNESDPAARKAAVAALWAADGTEVIETATYHGHEAIEARIAEAHETLVRDGGFVFRAAGDAAGHHDSIHFTTHMLPAGGGELAWTGSIFVKLGEDGLILEDHQFAVPLPETRAVVAELLRRTGEGDPDRIVELYAPTVDWRVSWPVEHHPVVPWIRPRSTRADIADHFHTFGKHCDPAEARVTVDDILVDGRCAVVTGTSSQLVKDTGKRFTMAFALRLTVEDGLVTRHHMYEDSLAVVQAFT
ncbi:nuclear transport factor 2 family protein [Amycolatopsis minnesotensis]|uniref:SnoaL-like domain-containing protein n=1 Tax=Amycolatopsis minnesotensis TaxID=337894 RepID=A0ABP5CQA9_9PSEU